MTNYEIQSATSEWQSVSPVSGPAPQLSVSSTEAPPSEQKRMPLIEVKNLKVYFKIQKGYVKAVDNVSWELYEGETLGLVGESGCGKTTTAFAIMGLLPYNGFIMDGEVLYNGRVIVEKFPEFKKELSQRQLEQLIKKQDELLRPFRWKEISIIFQSAMNAFNPVKRVGDQIVEAIMTHEKMLRVQAKEKVKTLYRQVGLDPTRVTGYPHEYSGGMKQRAMIAMALACDPKVVIADEPTTALDVIMQERILKEIKNLQKIRKLSMIIISHDISVVAETAQRIAIMYAGKIVEYGDIISIFKRTAHPYTVGLLNAFPSIIGQKKRLEAIPGSPPDLLNPPSGCRFHPRCKYAQDICMTTEPQLIEVEPMHTAACHFAKEIMTQTLGSKGV